MAETIEFRYQLGAVLPTLQEKIGNDVKQIFSDFASTLKAGTFDEEELDLSAVKELFLKNFDILLEKVIIPDVESVINPPLPATDAKDKDEKDKAVKGKDAKDKAAK